MSSDNLPETSTNDDPGTVEPQAPQEIEEVGESKSAFKPRRLLRGEITYEDAKENKTNIVHQLGYRTEKIRFYTHLYRKQESIKATVACHLGLRTTDQCSVVGVEDWIHGCFNVCIRVDVNDGRQVMFRCPLPYKIGEAFCPGNAEEKLRCEVGTYAWLQQNCSEIPIPHLYGFGFATGKRFTYIDNLPFLARTFQRLRRWAMRLFRYPLPTLYAETHAADSSELDTPYMVIEYINPSRGQMLSTTWNEGRDDPQLRSNLFRGLSKIMLTLMRIPLPRIGSFTLDDNGYLSLSNRPLNMDIQQLENEGISVNIPRDSTHLSVASYVYDIFAVHESRLRHQPNAVNDLEDGIYQTSALTMMRSVWSCFFSQDRHRGRFFLHLTDLSQSNVFVDKNWNINCIMDLEWAFSHPLEMIHPPHWLSNEAIDMITIDPFKVLYDEFMDTFAQVENQMDMPIGFHSTMKESLENGTFWCSLALSSPTALFAIFYDYIQPIFSRDHDGEAFWKITMYYWSFKAFKFLKQKVEDKQKYDISLREAFES